MNISLKEVDQSNPQHIEAVAGLWTTACGPALAISPRMVLYNGRPMPDLAQAGVLAWQADEPIGFVLASALKNQPAAAAPEQGWIDAIAVLPDEQKRGVGKKLLNWAEEWLRGQGCTEAALGGSLRPFAPGLPVELEQHACFEHLGFVPRERVWDVAANLAHYARSRSVREVAGAVRPAQPGQEAALLEFFQREFPGRWRYEFERFVQHKERLSDFMLLWTARGVDGFCRLTFEDSARPIERFYPYALPRPWGQLGPIGVSQDQRGLGYGAALLDAGLRRLHNNGVNGCIIDWTTIVDFYAKFGFAPHREYVPMSKQIA
ncbi:MAG: GNAT family N-acetyltransferase [Caldilineaceae bacterium]